MVDGKWPTENGRRKMDDEMAYRKRQANWPTGNPRQEIADAKKTGTQTRWQTNNYGLLAG